VQACISGGTPPYNSGVDGNRRGRRPCARMPRVDDDVPRLRARQLRAKYGGPTHPGPQRRGDRHGNRQRLLRRRRRWRRRRAVHGRLLRALAGARRSSSWTPRAITSSACPAPPSEARLATPQSFRRPLRRGRRSERNGLGYLIERRAPRRGGRFAPGGRGRTMEPPGTRGSSTEAKSTKARASVALDRAGMGGVPADASRRHHRARLPHDARP
jgi:hypothetical protein